MKRATLFIFILVALGCSHPPATDLVSRLMVGTPQTLEKELGEPDFIEKGTTPEVTVWKYRTRGISITLRSNKILSIAVHGGGEGYDLQVWGRFKGELPYQLSPTMSLEELKEALGEPTRVISETSLLWEKEPFLVAANYDSEGRLRTFTFTPAQR